MLPNFTCSSRKFCLPALPDVSASPVRSTLALFDDSSIAADHDQRAAWTASEQAYFPAPRPAVAADDSAWEPLCRVSHHQDATCVSDLCGVAEEAILVGRPEYFGPQRWTETTLESVCRNVQRIQTYCEPLHFFIESTAYLYRQESEMSEAEFLSRVLTRTGCGWLLNLTGVYANSKNFCIDPYDFLAEVLPAAHRTQIQLTGGYFDVDSGMYLDSPSDPIPDGVWELFRFALTQSRGKIEAVFIAHDPVFPNDPAWKKEIVVARELVDAAQRSTKRR